MNEMQKRYEVRHNNQVWHVFDTLSYRAVDARLSKAEAVEIVNELNG